MQNILLGISGGIAAYKSPLLVRLLRRQGFAVRCVTTPAANTFVSTQTLQALTGETVRSDLFDPAAEAAMGHIELARWADALIIAPAGANTLAKLAAGIADNLLTTLYLATTAPILLAPAMNHRMFAHPATQANLEILRRRPRHHLLPVGVGEQACGENGSGRMAEPEEILHALQSLQRRDLAGIRITVTAGPTREAVDPVRYLSNRSSGKMGYALAQAAVQRGADVTLISGPVALPAPGGCRLLAVESALQMHAAALEAAADSDIFIAAAAVADYRPARPAADKRKKSDGGIGAIELIENPDIVADVAAMPSARPGLVVGFAAETQNLLPYARSKREQKALDFIIANNVREHPFGGDDNQVVIIGATGEHTLPTMNKNTLAEHILDHLLHHYRSPNHA